MSDNFLKVKRKMIQAMKGVRCHTQATWSQIMLEASSRCITNEDQRSFFNYINNPDDSWDIPEIQFETIVPNDKPICIPLSSRMNDDEKSDGMLHNVVKTEGGICYILSTPEECRS